MNEKDKKIKVDERFKGLFKEDNFKIKGFFSCSVVCFNDFSNSVADDI